MVYSYFNENKNFNHTKYQLIEYIDEWGQEKIGMIYKNPNATTHEVTIILPANQNQQRDTINHNQIIDYLTKSGWSKIHKYLTDYSKAKEKWHFTKDGNLTKHELDIVASENDVNAYMYRYRKNKTTHPKIIRKPIKNIAKKCKCKNTKIKILKNIH